MNSFLKSLNNTSSFFKSSSSRSTSPATVEDKSHVELPAYNYSDLKAAKKPCMLGDSNSSSELVSLSEYEPALVNTAKDVLIVRAPESDLPSYDEYKSAGLTI
jgi:hypothetical protein